MSHIEEGRTTLVFADLAAALRQGDARTSAQHPCLVLLRQAVTLVAQAHHGLLTATYTSYAGKPQPTNTQLALYIPGKLPRGIGLLIDEKSGFLIFKGDPWGVDPAFYQRLQQEIVQTYTALAYGAALRRARFQQVQIQQQGEQIILTGVLHG
jgi:hypothetical protein